MGPCNLEKGSVQFQNVGVGISHALQINSGTTGSETNLPIQRVPMEGKRPLPPLKIKYPIKPNTLSWIQENIADLSFAIEQALLHKSRLLLACELHKKFKTMPLESIRQNSVSVAGLLEKKYRDTLCPDSHSEASSGSDVLESRKILKIFYWLVKGIPKLIEEKLSTTIQWEEAASGSKTLEGLIGSSENVKLLIRHAALAQFENLESNLVVRDSPFFQKEANWICSLLASRRLDASYCEEELNKKNIFARFSPKHGALKIYGAKEIVKKKEDEFCLGIGSYSAVQQANCCVLHPGAAQLPRNTIALRTRLKPFTPEQLKECGTGRERSHLTVIHRCYKEAVLRNRISPEEVHKKFKLPGIVSTPKQVINCLPESETPYPTAEVMPQLLGDLAGVAFFNHLNSFENLNLKREYLVKSALDLTYALSFFHAIGCVQRDIKPENIFFGPEMCLGDFDASCFESELPSLEKGSPVSSKQKSQMIKFLFGTPIYMYYLDTLGLLEADDTGTVMEIRKKMDVASLGIVFLQLLSTDSLKTKIFSFHEFEWRKVEILKNIPHMLSDRLLRIRNRDVSMAKIIETYGEEMRPMADLLNSMMLKDWRERISAKECFRFLKKMYPFDDSSTRYKLF